MVGVDMIKNAIISTFEFVVDVAIADFKRLKIFFINLIDFVSIGFDKIKGIAEPDY